MYHLDFARLHELLAHPFYSRMLRPWGGRPTRRIVTPNTLGCLIWQGAVNSKGYPVTKGGLVHRLAWAEFHGPIAPNHEIHHACPSGKACVNADHLQCLTREAHAALEGRPLKLDESKVFALLDRLHAGESRADVAREFDIKPSYVSQITGGYTWATAVRAWRDRQMRADRKAA